MALERICIWCKSGVRPIKNAFLKLGKMDESDFFAIQLPLQVNFFQFASVEYNLMTIAVRSSALSLGAEADFK